MLLRTVADTVTSLPTYQLVIVESTISTSGRNALIEIVAKRLLLLSLLSTTLLSGSAYAVTVMDCELKAMGAVNVNVTVRLAPVLSAERLVENVPILGTVSRTVVAPADVGPMFFTVADIVTVSHRFIQRFITGQRRYGQIGQRQHVE